MLTGNKVTSFIKLSSLVLFVLFPLVLFQLVLFPLVQFQLVLFPLVLSQLVLFSLVLFQLVLFSITLFQLVLFSLALFQFCGGGDDAGKDGLPGHHLPERDRVLQLPHGPSERMPRQCPLFPYGHPDLYPQIWVMVPQRG